MVGNGTVPTFGSCYDFRQKWPPCDHLCFWGHLPSVTHEQALANMRLFASRVVPRVRDAVEV